MNTLAPWAEHLAQVLLKEPLPRRWAHVQGVATRARSLAPVLGADAISWKPPHAARHRLRARRAVTGLQALDGARYLRDAQHADAIIEADERGLADILSLELQRPPTAFPPR